MTIATTTNRISYTGNGVTTLFAVPFTYYNASDLKVYVDGVLKTITTDYTVGSGGVTFVTAPASSKVVLIVREVPMTQTTDYKNFEPVDADELETNIDKLTVLVQQADEKAARGINLDVTDSATSLTLPVTRANKVLAFDASGLPVASTKTLAQIEAGSTNAAASAVAAAASAAAALVSENNAATTYDAFDDRYLGQKASDPTVDNDGGVLLVGALYFNTVSNLMKVWNGSAWSSFNPPFDIVTQSTGNLPSARVTPAGSNTQLQFNNAGALAGAAKATYNNATGQVSFGDNTTSGQQWVNIFNGNGQFNTNLNLIETGHATSKRAGLGLGAHWNIITDQNGDGTRNLSFFNGNLSANCLTIDTAGRVTLPRNVFTSANQTITSGGLLTLAHGLGVTPTLFYPFLVCTTADAGYAVNDVIPVNPHLNVDSVNGRGQAIYADATNVYVRFGNAASAYNILNKTTGAGATITNTSWRLIIRAYTS